MKSIQQRIIASTMILTCVAALLCGGVGIITNYTNTCALFRQDLETTATLAAERVSYELVSYKNLVESLGMLPELSDPEVTVQEKQAIIQERASQYGMERGNLLSTSGDSLFDGNNYSDREYFQQALQGNSWISTPTSEESAAASEELSGQAGIMKNLLDQFKLCQVSAQHSNSEPAPEAPASSNREYALDKY